MAFWTAVVNACWLHVFDMTKYHDQKWKIHHEGSKKTFFFPITCWWNNHLEIAHIIAAWLDSFSAYTHKSAGCPGSSKYTIRHVLFIAQNYDVVFVKFQELFFTKHSFLYFQDFHAVEFSRVNTRSLWVVFHQAGSLQNEQSLLFQGVLELSKATNFLKRGFWLLFYQEGSMKWAKFAFSTFITFKSTHFCQKMYLSSFSPNWLRTKWA